MFKLISFNLCPYVQRSVITLEEKNVPYEIQYIDLNQKPDWFLKLSPTGKVPVLQVGEIVLFESAVINEYLDEVTPGPRLLPSDPLAKARARAWIEFGSSLLADSYQFTMVPDRGTAMRNLPLIRTKFERLAEAKAKGDFFLGDQFSLVDSAIAPALQRLQWCENIAPDVKIFSDIPVIANWVAKLLARPSVKRSILPNLESIYREYLQGRGSPTRNAEPSWLGRI